MTILATILSGLSLLMSHLFLIRLKFPLGFFYRMDSETDCWSIVSLLGDPGHNWRGIRKGISSVLGDSDGDRGRWHDDLVCLASYRDHDGFEKAFGPDWSDKIAPEQTKCMVQQRWKWYLCMKVSPEAIWERDTPFWTVPGTDRELLCDLWRPVSGDVSGLAFIYFHGGGWYIGDKDILTRPFFRHLAAQGHTVMDVSYRLCPEADIYGMIGDVKRAIAWMKANASLYGVNPEKIVLGGASAGGHLALLAGYTPRHPELIPDDIKGADLSVCGVVSYYPPTDLMAMYQHTGQQKLINLHPVTVGPDATTTRRDFGRLEFFLGSWPQDNPDIYQLGSPATHVHPGSPPTLLFHGVQDVLVTVEPTRALYKKLVETGVPAIKVIFPWTDHAFDALSPQTNPAAQSALYDVDRFLALMLNKD